MRKLLLAGVAVAALTAASDAHAQASVYCVNCSTIVQDLKDYAIQLQQLQQEIQSVQTEINFWTTLVQNTISLPARIFGDVSGTINSIENIGQQVSRFSSQTGFMVSNLANPTGFPGGSVAYIPGQLIAEDHALAAAMQRLGLVNDQTQPVNQQYTTKLASLEGTGASGTTQAIQVGNSIAATVGQQTAAQAQVTNSALQALATAETRRADRESMIAAKVSLDRGASVVALCSQLTTMHPPVCGQQPNSGSGSPGGGGSVSPTGSYVAVAGTGTPIPGGGTISDTTAYSINAAPNTPSGGSISDSTALSINAAADTVP